MNLRRLIPPKSSILLIVTILAFGVVADLNPHAPVKVASAQVQLVDAFSQKGIYPAVVIVNRTIFAVTNQQGSVNFTRLLADKAYQFTIRAIGYPTYNTNVTLSSGNTPIKIVMTSSPTTGWMLTGGNQGPCTEFISLDGTTPEARIQVQTTISGTTYQPGDNFGGTAGEDFGVFMNAIMNTNTKYCLSAQLFTASTNILPQNGDTFSGQGWNTQIKWSGAASANQGMFYGTGLNHVTFDDFSIHGNDVEIMGIYLVASNNNHAYNMEVQHFPGFGIKFEQSGADQNEANDNYVHDLLTSPGAGVGIIFDAGNYNKAIGNLIVNTRDDCLAVDNSRNGGTAVGRAVIADNTCVKSGTAVGTCITLADSGSNTVTGNYCKDSPAYGISAADLNFATKSKEGNNTISSNILEGNIWGIFARNMVSGTIASNTVNYNTKIGIYMFQNVTDVSITGNSCMNNGTAGDTTDAGIHMEGVTNSTITGNTCGDNQTTHTQNYGIREVNGLSGASQTIASARNLIADNNVFGNTLAQISSASTTSIIVNNKGYNPLPLAATLTVGASPFNYTNNDFPFIESVQIQFLSSNPTVISQVQLKRAGQSAWVVCSGTTCPNAMDYILDYQDSITVTYTSTAPVMIKQAIGVIPGG